MPAPEKPDNSRPSIHDTEVGAEETSFLRSERKADYCPICRSEISPKKDDFAPDWVYANIDEAAKNCRKIFFIYLGLLSYILLTAFTTSDHHLILGRNVQLPVFGAAVPGTLFFWLAAAVATGIFVYIQLYWLKISKLIALAVKKCCETNQNTQDCKNFRTKSGDKCSIHNICEEHENRLYPWIMIFSKYSQERFLGKLQRVLTQSFLWLSLPIVLMLLSILTARKHDRWLSSGMLGFALVGTIIVFGFWCRYKFFEIKPAAAQIRSSESTKRKKENQEITSPRHPGIRKYIPQFIPGFILLIIVIAFLGWLKEKIDEANRGLLWSMQVSWEDEVGLGTGIFKKYLFIDLSQQILIDETLPGKTTSNLKDDLSSWVNLENAKLQGANLAATILKNSWLKKADLQRANLDGAILDNTVFDEAILDSASLGEASLRHASFRGAQLKGCDLASADLQGANFNYANLQKVDLRWAKLESANFYGANLYRADLRQAIGISKEQLKENEGRRLALYSPALLQSLELPEDHNKRVQIKNFRDYDMRQANLRGVDLSGADLKNANLKEADLTQANLSRADLKNANLKEADLKGADLRRADLQGARLKGADLQGVKLQGALHLRTDQILSANNYQLAFYSQDWLKKLDFPANHNRRLEEKDFAGYRLQRASLRQADLRGANLSGANLWQANLSEANLEGADLKNANLKEADLFVANLKDADLRGAILAYADLQQANLRGVKGISKDLLSRTRNYELAYYSQDSRDILGLRVDHNSRVAANNFGGYDLQNANLQNAKLTKANFNAARLQNANLRKATLTMAILNKADLKGAIFKDADLRRADLQGVDLRDADLRGADLSEVNLQGADLRGARLAYANLQYADLRKARGISRDQIYGAKNFQLALYSEDMLDLLDPLKLKLFADHNARVQERNFEGYNFQRANLKNADFFDANLKNANLKNADLREADLTDADLQYADLRQAIGISKDSLEEASNWKLAFYSISIGESLGLKKNHNKRVEEKNFRDFDFRKASLKGADLQRADLWNAKLEGTDLQWADLRGARHLRKDQLLSAGNCKLAFYDQDWLKKLELPVEHNKKVEAKNFAKYPFEGAALKGADLKEAILNKVNLREADLRTANLKEAVLSEAILQKADLTDANLSKANLEKADLENAILTNADLLNADLWRANLKGADLENTDLRGADLRKADLTGTDLENADLRGADLRKADLTGTVFQLADLGDILYDGYEQFAEAATLFQTKMDKSLRVQLKAKYPSLFKKPVSK
jgi:uncharacterized protein YjbI with pentapeptide repeats